MEIRCHTPGVRVMQLWACTVLALLAIINLREARQERLRHRRA